MYGLKDEAVKLMRLRGGDGKTTVGPTFEYVPREHAASRAARCRRSSSSGRALRRLRQRPADAEEEGRLRADDSISWRKTETIETEETYASAAAGSRARSRSATAATRARLRRHRAADARPTIERIRIVEGSLAEEDAETVHEGPGIVVKRDGYLCMHAAFCVGRLKRIPAMMEGTADSDVRAAIIGMIERCPSGSYCTR